MTTGSTRLSPELVDEFRRLVRDARDRLLTRAARTEAELGGLEPHQPGAPVEDVARELATNVLSRLDWWQRREVDELDAAEARLDAGTFGICERCGRPIPLERLRAVVTARSCMTCQARAEHGAPEPGSA